MATLRDLGSRGQTILMLDPHVIKVKPDWNARDMKSAETQKEIMEIAQSIAARGFLSSQPIEVFQEDGTPFVSQGHKRLAAALMAVDTMGVPLEKIPCLQEAPGTKPLDRELNQVIGNSGSRVGLAGEGKIYSRALSMGATIDVIAQRCGRSITHVNNALNFYAAPEEAHTAVREGKIAASTAAKMVRENGSGAGVRLITEAVQRAESAGRGKVKPRDLAAAPAPPQPRQDRPPNAGKLAFDFVRRLAKRADPLAGEFDDELRAFATLITEAREIAEAL